MFIHRNKIYQFFSQWDSSGLVRTLDSSQCSSSLAYAFGTVTPCVCDPSAVLGVSLTSSTFSALVLNFVLL